MTEITLFPQPRKLERQDRQLHVINRTRASSPLITPLARCSLITCGPPPASGCPCIRWMTTSAGRRAERHLAGPDADDAAEGYRLEVEPGASRC